MFSCSFLIAFVCFCAFPRSFPLSFLFLCIACRVVAVAVVVVVVVLWATGHRFPCRSQGGVHRLLPLRRGHLVFPVNEFNGL